jgi:hypothetical protein
MRGTNLGGALHKRDSQGISGPAPAPRSCSCHTAATPKRYSPPPPVRHPRRPSGPRTGGSPRCTSGAVHSGRGHRCAAQHARWAAGSPSGPVPATVPRRRSRRPLPRPRAPQRPALLSGSASLGAGAATPERRADPPGQKPEHARRVPRSRRRTPRRNDKAVPAYAVPFAHELTCSEHGVRWAGLDRPANPGRRSAARSRTPPPTTTTLCRVSAMTPPSSDVIRYRPAGDGAAEKCGHVVQQINYRRWLGDPDPSPLQSERFLADPCRPAAEYRRSLFQQVTARRALASRQGPDAMAGRIRTPPPTPSCSAPPCTAPAHT